MKVITQRKCPGQEINGGFNENINPFSAFPELRLTLCYFLSKD
jgi:hypothetical protein